MKLGEITPSINFSVSSAEPLGSDNTALAHHAICFSVTLQITELHERSYVLHSSLMIKSWCANLWFSCHKKGLSIKYILQDKKTTVSLTSAMLNLTQNSLIKLGIANGHCGSKMHLLHYKVKFFTQSRPTTMLQWTHNIW